jgi:hypothetical protein
MTHSSVDSATGKRISELPITPDKLVRIGYQKSLDLQAGANRGIAFLAVPKPVTGLARAFGPPSWPTHSCSTHSSCGPPSAPAATTKIVRPRFSLPASRPPTWPAIWLATAPFPMNSALALCRAPPASWFARTSQRFWAEAALRRPASPLKARSRSPAWTNAHRACLRGCDPSLPERTLLLASRATCLRAHLPGLAQVSPFQA